MNSTPMLNVEKDCSNRKISCESDMIDIFKELAARGFIGGNRMEATCYVSIESLLTILNFYRFDGYGVYHVGPYKLNIRIRESAND